MSINIVVLVSVLVGLGWTTGTSTSILDQRSASRNFSHDCVYSLGVEEQDANSPSPTRLWMNTKSSKYASVKVNKMR